MGGECGENGYIRKMGGGNTTVETVIFLGNHDSDGLVSGKSIKQGSDGGLIFGNRRKVGSDQLSYLG